MTLRSSGASCLAFALLFWDGTVLAGWWLCVWAVSWPAFECHHWKGSAVALSAWLLFLLCTFGHYITRFHTVLQQNHD